MCSINLDNNAVGIQSGHDMCLIILDNNVAGIQSGQDICLINRVDDAT